MSNDTSSITEQINAMCQFNLNEGDAGGIKGHYDIVCRGPDGELKWADKIENVICVIGKNLILDAALAGSAYTVTGPFMGLISGASAPTIVAADTMGSHAGWIESGGTNAPAYSGTRKTAAWNAASGGAKALSAALAFTFTNSGTVSGCFLASGAGAVNTQDNTSGALVSAGTFTGGIRIVGSADVINSSYTMTLT